MISRIDFASVILPMIRSQLQEGNEVFYGPYTDINNKVVRVSDNGYFELLDGNHINYSVFDSIDDALNSFVVIIIMMKLFQDKL